MRMSSKFKGKILHRTDVCACMYQCLHASSGGGVLSVHCSFIRNFSLLSFGEEEEVELSTVNKVSEPWV